MKDFLELISKIRKTESSSEESSVDSDENKEECPLTLEEVFSKFDEYSNTGKINELEFMNQYSFKDDRVKKINDKLNQMIINFYDKKDYEKLSFILDEFHRDSNILDGSVLCEMILISIKEDNHVLLLSLLMGDYANFWTDYHTQKAWELLLKNLDNGHCDILKSFKDHEKRSTIIDILM